MTIDELMALFHHPCPDHGDDCTMTVCARCGAHTHHVPQYATLSGHGWCSRCVSEAGGPRAPAARAAAH
jgi:hypothetical protein